MSSAFYIQTATSVAAWWGLVAITTQKPLYKVTESSVVTIPSWMPKGFILLLQRFRPLLFNCETIGLALAASFYNHEGIRILAAILYTLYHLTESSETNRHGEYPILYTMWAMACITDLEYRHACAWGIAIHFVFSSGYAKLVVGRVSKNGVPRWLHPSTMETYLTTYREARHSQSRPLLPDLNRRLCDSKFLTSTIATSVLLLECILVPGTLFVDAEYRPLACYAMIFMHIGIALCMSFRVGFVFLTSLPTYLYGFQSSAEFGTGPWIVAALVGLGPTLVSMLVFAIPENWPLTPVSLFMWNGKTAQRLLELLMTGDTRMVLATARVAHHSDLIGLRVLHHGQVVVEKKHEDDFVVHDCVLRTIGFTMIQGGEPVMEAARELENDSTVDGAATQMLLHRTWAWLTLDRRLVESHTGEDLTHVYLVRIDESMRVTDVLL
jgi:hypothetical protein